MPWAGARDFVRSLCSYLEETSLESLSVAGVLALEQKHKDEGPHQRTKRRLSAFLVSELAEQGFPAKHAGGSEGFPAKRAGGAWWGGLERC